MKRIAVVGGGAAGLMAAGSAAANPDNMITVFESNNILGRKLLITGKGRCNVTNNCDRDTFLKNVVCNAKFLYSAINNLSSGDLMNIIEDAGTPLKTERGRRVFPLSDKSADILNALKNYALKDNVKIEYKKVKEIIAENGKITGIISDKFYGFDSVILATGGLSYPQTGSKGDGFRFAEKLGHTVIEPSPALVPIILDSNAIKNFEGLSLKNVVLTLYKGNKIAFSELGELLFTSNGISGPLALSASSYINGSDYSVSIDLKPALSHDKLNERILRDFSEFINKNADNAFSKLLPKSIIPYIIERASIDPKSKVNEITKEKRLQLVSVIKNLTFDVAGLGGFDEAIITKGGVKTSEIDPKTMKSKIIEGLYFAGEIIDVNALTGGYNLQIAFSTGYTAGLYA